MHLEDPYKKDLLKTSDIMERAHILIELLQKESQVVMMEKALMEMVKISIDKGQKEFFLREQLKVIQKELGDKTGTLRRQLSITDMLTGSLVMMTPRPSCAERYRDCHCSNRDHLKEYRSRCILTRFWNFPGAG
jgi:hypothetical protein